MCFTFKIRVFFICYNRYSRIWYCARNLIVRINRYACTSGICLSPTATAYAIENGQNTTPEGVISEESRNPPPHYCVRGHGEWMEMLLFNYIINKEGRNPLIESGCREHPMTSSQPMPTPVHSIDPVPQCIRYTWCLPLCGTYAVRRRTGRLHGCADTP